MEVGVVDHRIDLVGRAESLFWALRSGAGSSGSCAMYVLTTQSSPPALRGCTGEPTDRLASRRGRNGGRLDIVVESIHHLVKFMMSVRA